MRETQVWWSPLTLGFTILNHRQSEMNTVSRRFPQATVSLVFLDAEYWHCTDSAFLPGLGACWAHLFYRWWWLSRAMLSMWTQLRTSDLRHLSDLWSPQSARHLLLGQGRICPVSAGINTVPSGQPAWAAPTGFPLPPALHTLLGFTTQSCSATQGSVFKSSGKHGQLIFWWFSFCHLSTVDTLLSECQENATGPDPCCTMNTLVYFTWYSAPTRPEIYKNLTLFRGNHRKTCFWDASLVPFYYGKWDLNRKWQLIH